MLLYTSNPLHFGSHFLRQYIYLSALFPLQNKIRPITTINIASTVYKVIQMSSTITICDRDMNASINIIQ